MAERPSKRPRLELTDAEDARARRTAFLSSLSRQVTPPPATLIRSTSGASTASTVTASDGEPEKQASGYTPSIPTAMSPERQNSRGFVSSPFQLTKIPGFPAVSNIDTVSLSEILGDPLIREVWIFNFCFDVDFIIRHLDADTRDLTKIYLVHGSWRNEDINRAGIEEACRRYANISEIRAYLPDAFGTHHSKMFVIFKHDDTAQVIIHTANMLEKDWHYMTQSLWRSPVLPMQQKARPELDNQLAPVGSGIRFGQDLGRYIAMYGNKLKPLLAELEKYDFSAIRATLVASAPSRFRLSDPPDKQWGWPQLNSSIRSLHRVQHGTPHLISQVSSIASLPKNWLKNTLYETLPVNATTSIIFPTVSDMRTSVTGYATGGSIHMKAQSAAHLAQIEALRPQLSRWNTESKSSTYSAGRNLVPPHIKTYTCFSSKPTEDNPCPDMEWALLTSANISTQAWGTAPRVAAKSRTKKTNSASAEDVEGEVHIQSFEIGVLIWPDLFLEKHERGKVSARMVSAFGTNTPNTNTASARGNHEQESRGVVVGLRMPYDLPLTPYTKRDMPWSPNGTYNEPDTLGEIWP